MDELAELAATARRLAGAHLLVEKMPQLAAAGLWMLKKWGVWLAVVVCALNFVSAAPGIPFGPDAALRVAATATVLVSALIIVLVVLPASRRAFAAT